MSTYFFLLCDDKIFVNNRCTVESVVISLIATDINNSNADYLSVSQSYKPIPHPINC